MENTKERHVEVPHNKLSLKDNLVYATIKRHMNGKSYSCYPSLETIKKESGLSIPTIRKSIQTLKDANLISTSREPGCSTVYTFNKDCKEFEMFSIDFLNDMETMTPEQKGYYITWQAHAFANKTTEQFVSEYSNTQLAKRMGCSLNTVKKYNKQLVDKGIFNAIILREKDEYGLNKTAMVANMHTLNQAVLFLHEEQQEMKEDINALTARMDRMEQRELDYKKEIARLKFENQLLKQSKDVEYKKSFDF